MSDEKTDSSLIQNGSQSEGTKNGESTKLYSLSQASTQSNDSHYSTTQFIEPLASEKSSFTLENDAMLQLNTEGSSQSIEGRAAQLMELVTRGSINELQSKIIGLLRENDELKMKLRQMQSESEKPQNNASCIPVEEFCIDSAPSEFDHNLPDTSMGPEIRNTINYDVINNGEKLSLAQSNSTEQASQTKTGKSSSANSCFNCLGSHLISECKEQRDYKRINKNRRSFQSRQGLTSARYHVDEGQKFGHIQPGQCPSNSLLKALGMKDNRYLPPYIYQMRKLGYPPAWLKYAQINRKYYHYFLDILVVFNSGFFWVNKFSIRGREELPNCSLL